MKVSILCPIHRYGGLDVLFDSLSAQTFSKSDYELILIDKLYKYRHDIVEDWKNKEGINVLHLPPTKESEYHAHSSVLNQALRLATGDCSIIIGDYSYLNPDWMERHYLHYINGWCLTAPQLIYSLPKLKENLKQCYSVFAEPFNREIFKLLPYFILDPKLHINYEPISHKYCQNRNESFPTEKALQIGGFDERFNNTVGPSNKEFYLRLIHETNCKFVNDPSNRIFRILSYPIPPFTKFEASEMDDSRTMTIYKEMCKKYNAEE